MNEANTPIAQKAAAHSATQPQDWQPCEQYFWQRQPLRERTGSDIFAALFQPEIEKPGSEAIATLLESPYPLPPDSLPEQATEMARYSICAGSPRVVADVPQLQTPGLGLIRALLRQMDSAPSPTHYLANSAETTGREESASVVLRPEDLSFGDLPFTGGWLGWIGYDCAWEIEKLPWLKEDALPFPVAYWYEPAEFAVLDHHSQVLWLAAETTEQLAALEAKLSAGSSEDRPISGDRPLTQTTSSIYRQSEYRQSDRATAELTFQTEQADFEAAVRQAKAHIKAGDVFQVNHSLRFQAKTKLSSWAVYRTLHQINPSPFASYWRSPWGDVVSCSPERLVQLQNRRAQTRPIAGTRPRGRSVADDGTIAEELMGDRKEQAEHIMLVDLERNDLGRVCKWGSVQVEELMAIERYSHVMHLVSNVVGELQSDKGRADLVAALFPGGTITGCPKVRCMEIIEQLEPVRRSLFYGSCGYFDRRGQLDLNILIRTLLMTPTELGQLSQERTSTQTVWGQVGAGIVADSDPTKEWYESLQKAKAQLLSLGL